MLEWRQKNAFFTEKQMEKINIECFCKKKRNVELYLSGKLKFCKLSVILDWKASMYTKILRF